MKLKLSIVCLVAALFVATPAQAQVTGRGVYAGAGISFDMFDVQDLDFGSSPANVNGVDISFFGGYGFKVGKLVIGPELVFSLGFGDGEDGAFLLPASIKRTTDIRARVGFDHGKIQPYVAIGWVMTGFQADHEGNGDSDDIANDTARGYSLNFGVDFAANDKSFFRGEFGWLKYSDDVFPFYGANDPHEYSAKGMRLIFAYGRRF